MDEKLAPNYASTQDLLDEKPRPPSGPALFAFFNPDTLLLVVPHDPVLINRTGQ